MCTFIQPAAYDRSTIACVSWNFSLNGILCYQFNCISITSLCLQVVEETGPWKDVLLTKTFAATPSAALATILLTLEHWWYVFVLLEQLSESLY